MAGEKINEIIAIHGAAGRTGTAMIVFEDNSLGRFYFAGGLLVTARYKNKQGQLALDEAALHTVQTAKFHDEADLVRSAEFIEGQAIPVATAPVAAAPQPVAARPVNNGPVLTHVMRSGISELLTEYIGPVAPVVMAELPEGIDIESAIDQLSKEISDTRSAANFVRDARQISLQ